MSYREGLVMLGQRLAVLEGVDGDHLVAPAVDVLQPQQEAVARLVEVLQSGHRGGGVMMLQLCSRKHGTPQWCGYLLTQADNHS